MIINVGLRTDIVQHYSDWLFRRFREGFAYSRNPLFPNRLNRYELSPDKVDAVVFCSKDYSPALGRIREITDRFRTYFFYTITSYGTDLEPNIPDTEQAIETLIALSETVGKQRVAWRYDPVLITDVYTAEKHFLAFDRILRKVRAHIDRCIFSFVEMFPKLQLYVPDLVPLNLAKKRVLATEFGKIAKKYSVPVQTCGGGKDFEDCGVPACGCTTLDLLGRANGVVFRSIRHNGMKRRCRCIESRDLGWYDSCPNLCKYCNANRDRSLVADNYAAHDPASPLLIGQVRETDVILKAAQFSYLKNDGSQISFFDL